MELGVLDSFQTFALRELSKYLSDAGQSTGGVFDSITRTIVRMLGASLCTVRLLDENNRLQLMSVEGMLKNSVYTGGIELEKDCMGMAIKENERVSFENLEGLEYTPYNKAVLDSGINRYVFFLPIRVGKQAAGVATICSSDAISENDIEILSSILDMASSALEKAELERGLKKLYFNSIKTLVKTIEAKDIYTKGHSIRVSQYASGIAQRLNFSRSEIEEAEITGILHDIGKIGVNDVILTKPESLNEVEMEVIKQHPFFGSKILEPIGFSESIINGTLLHHKRFDLKGYPVNMGIKELPIMPRIIGAADAFDAMTSIRPYKRPMSKKEAIIEMKRYTGTQFCPQIVSIMEEMHSDNLL